MRTTLIASVVLTSLAAATAAGMMLSTPTRAIGPLVERVATPASTTTPPAPAPVATVAVAPSPRSEFASVEAARPPVPLRVNHKPPLPDKPNGKARVDTNGKPSTDTPEAADATAEQKSQQAAAKAAIEADGYKSVQILSQASNGVWKASALRGKTRVVVSVDQAGNVFTE